ncbi:MAG: hypothetical protein E7Z75_10265 [Methanobrevibacter olleyae]|uniref:Uncharacterized protein n=1 Tax=Methanobrevibacter olleyae TaxID=294671 RepID=A0A8T3VZQ9_METOL|nr:hypothetical protein [Methanobrevibacter olleyae]
MKNKLFAILIVAILAIVSLGGVYALDIGSIFDTGNSVTVDGVRFNVPDGFEEVISNSTTKYNRTVDNIPYYSEIKNYAYGNDTVSLSVSKNPSHKATDETAKHYGGDSETINGVSGYLEYHPQTVTKFTSGKYIYTFTTYPYYTFAYAKDDKLVIVSASEKEYLSDILIA